MLDSYFFMPIIKSQPNKGKEMSLLSGVKPVKTTVEDNVVAVKESSWTANRQQGIIESLKKQGTYDILLPKDNELKYADGVYVSSNLTNIDSVTEETVQNIGKKELENLNNSMKDFISGLNLISSENTGIYDLMTDLSKAVNPEELKDIWQKAVNAKPTILAMIIGIFNSPYKEKNVINQVNELSKIIDRKGKSVSGKIDGIENDLIKQKEVQKDNIKQLNKTFEIYYKAVKDLRLQYIIAMYIQYDFKKNLASYKNSNQDNQSIEFTKKISEYERIDSLIDNKCLLMQKSLMQILIAVKNNDNLIKVCYNLLSEIDNTITHSLPNIRSNIATIAVALRAERGLRENQAVQLLEDQQGAMATEITGALSVKAELLSGSNRKREASAMEKLVLEAERFDNEIKKAKEQKKKDIDESFKIMYNAQIKFNDLLKKGN
jgi:hypothetical protein